MKKKKFSEKQIKQAFTILEERLATLNILAEVIAPFFTNNKFVNSHPLRWVLVQLIHYVTASITRCWFDQAHGKYKTVSMRELYCQIQLNKRFLKFSDSKKASFFKLIKYINKAAKYEKRLKTLSDKHIFHREIRTVKQRRKEFETLKIRWDKVVCLINDGKKLTIEMQRIWDSNHQLNFEEASYKYFREGFWGVIDKAIFLEISK